MDAKITGISYYSLIMSNIDGPKDDATEQEKTQFWKDHFCQLEGKFVQQIEDLKKEYEAKLKEARTNKDETAPVGSTPSPSTNADKLIEEVRQSVGSVLSQLKLAENDIRHNSFMASYNEERYEEGNQYGRVSTLLAHKLEGIPEKQYGKEFYDFVLKFLNERFPSKECKVERHHIDIAHTLRTRNKKSKPVLLIKFCNRWVRDMIYFNKRDLKGSGISISEHLTPFTRQLLDAAATSFGAENVWTRNCIVTALVSSSKRVSFRNFTELNKFTNSNYRYNNPDFENVPISFAPVVRHESASSPSTAISPALQTVFNSQISNRPPPGFVREQAGASWHH